MLYSPYQYLYHKVSIGPICTGKFEKSTVTLMMWSTFTSGALLSSVLSDKVSDISFDGTRRKGGLAVLLGLSDPLV